MYYWEQRIESLEIHRNMFLYYYQVALVFYNFEIIGIGTIYIVWNCLEIMFVLTCNNVKKVNLHNFQGSKPVNFVYKGNLNLLDR